MAITPNRTAAEVMLTVALLNCAKARELMGATILRDMLIDIEFRLGVILRRLQEREDHG
jgi:hypothetical protein